MEVCYSACDNIQVILAYAKWFFILFYYFYVFLEGEGRKWMVIVGCEEREMIKKNQ